MWKNQVQQEKKTGMEQPQPKFTNSLVLAYEESQITEESNKYHGALIMQQLIQTSVGQPLILHIYCVDLIMTDQQSTYCIRPKRHYGCMIVILQMLDKLEISSLLHEIGFDLTNKSCTDPLFSGPIMDLLSTKKYQFFLKAQLSLMWHKMKMEALAHRQKVDIDVGEPELQLEDKVNFWTLDNDRNPKEKMDRSSKTAYMDIQANSYGKVWHQLMINRGQRVHFGH